MTTDKGFWHTTKKMTGHIWNGAKEVTEDVWTETKDLAGNIKERFTDNTDNTQHCKMHNASAASPNSAATATDNRNNLAKTAKKKTAAKKIN